MSSGFLLSAILFQFISYSQLEKWSLENKLLLR